LDRVFLDANVLFSAAHVSESRLLVLWSLQDVELVTSLYALEEARRNLPPDGVDALDGLIERMTVVTGAGSGRLPDGVALADKDIPILLAAIDSGCTHLLTGDKRHSDRLYGRKVGGVLIRTPAQYLRSREA